MTRALGLSVLLFLSALPPTLHAQSLGRLFLTSEQRAALDLRRASRVPDKPAAVVVESPTARIDGHVVRSDGRSTVWVNGQPVREGGQSEGLRVAPASSTADSVSLAIGEGTRRVELKVGESMNRDTGEVRGMLGEGKAGRSATVRAAEPGGAQR
ncbi:MAG TPA: hypothetical protein VLA41_10860 [Burkholderiales bacterium]|nr:hypothetical protein [Burkholderiales bacterium]